jgi:hypothetical protein
MKTAFIDEFEKISNAGGVSFLPGLMKTARPNEDFAVSSKKSNTGKPAYPIPDKKHAISALGFAKMHHDSADLAEVRKDVAAKYPDLVHKAASVLVAVTKFANDSCVPKKGKEKDSNMGMGTYGPASAAPPGMMGGPPPGAAMKATMQAGM